MSDDKAQSVQDNSKSGLFDKIGNLFQGEPKNQQELLDIIQGAKQREVIDQKTKEMIKGVLDVSQLRVRDIMIPRSQMVTLGLHQTVDEFLPEIIESTHSRFPVITEDKDHVVGLLLAKDLIKFGFTTEANDFKIEDILREAVVVPESKRLDSLLTEFRSKRYHMAIVVDEYGGVSGLVTIEDILEVIVGEIEDEFDDEEADEIRKIGKRTYVVNALTSIDDFNQYFSTSFNSEDQDTIGGLIVHELGHLPDRGESILIDDYKFKVTNADSRRLVQLQLRIPKELKAINE
ncbi:CNNM family magnesium/cobalt transport protein CorC [Psychromonas antarctica]|jgi:magnesium and cobalt transporter|uniref:CNNM family magnesium/cobalt transport protein CorC n=1 Tax=Psychromonas antarctica TaxID=67573 RepID=UPI001EE954A1|nr:CNNM family magnesium/cobalt transport protein CorC [Psychromonas antarctica]MCG6199753.1 CNNM family magnesium/cobalt transport protein CorC [Psychromonas antarctica]